MQTKKKEYVSKYPDWQYLLALSMIGNPPTTWPSDVEMKNEKGRGEVEVRVDNWSLRFHYHNNELTGLMSAQADGENEIHMGAGWRFDPRWPEFGCLFYFEGENHDLRKYLRGGRYERLEDVVEDLKYQGIESTVTKTFKSRPLYRSPVAEPVT